MCSNLTVSIPYVLKIEQYLEYNPTFVDFEIQFSHLRFWKFQKNHVSLMEFSSLSVLISILFQQPKWFLMICDWVFFFAEIDINSEIWKLKVPKSFTDCFFQKNLFKILFTGFTFSFYLLILVFIFFIYFSTDDTYYRRLQL